MRIVNDRLQWIAGLALGALVAMTGCASQNSKLLTASFARQARELASSLPDTLVAVRSAQLEHNQLSALASDQVGFNTATQPEISLESLRLRVQLADALSRYAQSLLGLTSDEEEKRIQAASRELYGALTDVNATLGQAHNGMNPVEPEQLQGIATAVNAAAQAYFEWQRLKALRQVVEHAKPLVDEATNLFSTELPTWSSSQQLALSDSAHKLFQLAQMGDGFNRKCSSTAPICPIPHNGLLEPRESLLQRAVDARQRSDATEPVFKSTIESFNRLREAHDSVGAALADDSTLNINNARAKIDALSNEINETRSFYKSLGQKTADAATGGGND